MVEITCDCLDWVLNLKVSGDMFADTVETLKYLRVSFDRAKKTWVAPIFDFQTLEKELAHQGEDLEISELTRRQVAAYIRHTNELVHSTERRKIRLEKMNFPPLVGKSPNQDFQVVDIGRALNQNRFLFNWEMGLGKSYALAVLLTSLRHYDLVDKCIILSTGVGVYNLKDELVKFGKNLNPDEIYPISSVMEMEDREIFNSEKFPYKILIMTYDTFKEINNFYYDKNNAKKKDIALVDSLESELEKYILELKDDWKSKGNLIKNLNLNEDKTIQNLKKQLSSAREKLHPSRNIKYSKSPLPLKEWLGEKDGVLFLDECHSLSNPKSRRSEVLSFNLEPFFYRYEFTGTLADKYEKLYQPLYILDKSLVHGKSYQDWLYEYNEVGTKWSKYAINPNRWRTGKLAELNGLLLKNYASKRKMQECLDLPLNYSVPTLLLDMTKEHREIYEDFVKEQIRLLKEKDREAQENGKATQKDNLLNMFQIFSMACDNIGCIKKSPTFEKFNPVLKEKITNYKYTEHNRKLEALGYILEERVDDEGERGIVWYNHPLTKDSLVGYLKKYNPVIIDAGLSNEELNSRIKEFKSNTKHKVLIASINIMNTSVTLTECKFAVYLERTYSYQIWSQSKGRIWRPSQDSVTRVYTMSYKNSIDNLQLENLTHKGEVVNSLLNRDYITQETWRKIFNFNLGDVL